MQARPAPGRPVPGSSGPGDAAAGLRQPARPCRTAPGPGAPGRRRGRRRFPQQVENLQQMGDFSPTMFCAMFCSLFPGPVSQDNLKKTEVLPALRRPIHCHEPPDGP